MSFMNLTTRKALFAASLAISAAHGALAAIPIQQWSLTNGATVSLVESHGIPMVDVELDFDGGGRRDPAGKSGLASVAASMTSKGIGAADGTALDENQLSEAWADLGASFGGGASSDRMSFTMRSLTYPDLLPKAAQLAARQLGDPTFPQAIWLRDRERFAASIREANTRPGTVAGRAFAAAVYGTHPYGAETTEASLAQIDVADMRDF